MKYASVDEFGRIVQTGSHPCEIPGWVDIALPAWASDITHYFDFGSGTFTEFPPQPSVNHMFDWSTRAWVDPRTLEQLKDSKWEEIKASRELAFDAPLVTPHGTFDSDTRARSNITDAVLMAQALTAMGSPVSIDFTLADNSVVTLNAAQMIEVGLYLGAKVQGAYAVSRALRSAIDAATTSAEVQAIAWP